MSAIEVDQNERYDEFRDMKCLPELALAELESHILPRVRTVWADARVTDISKLKAGLVPLTDAPKTDKFVWGEIFIAVRKFVDNLPTSYYAIFDWHGAGWELDTFCSDPRICDAFGLEVSRT